jgi:uncharacterized protein with GYD domain
MATFISLINLTDQGIRNVKDSPDRFEAFAALAEKAGVKVTNVLYTIGQYDMVVIIEGDEKAAMAVMFKVAAMGNVRSQTLRGYSINEMRGILAG